METPAIKAYSSQTLPSNAPERRRATTNVRCTVSSAVRHRLHPLLLLALPLLLLALPLLLASQPQRRTAAIPVKQPPPAEAYAGDDACRSCHQSESATYAATAHHLTSRPGDARSILGSFAQGANTLVTSNPALTFRMSADADGFRQTAVDQLSPTKAVELTEPINIAVGSGRKAQTYLYWKADDLFELPVSYWIKTNQWINSPGYVDGTVRFDRPIYPRCLECHANSFNSSAPPANRFDRSSVVLGITCERCHGPARAHAAFYTEHPSGSGGKPAPAEALLHLAALSRDRQIDACALCHAGLGRPLAPALSFQPGEPLDRYLQIPPMDATVPVDVHGNQVQLLRRSLCFQKSAMTCTTCHNVHQTQREAVAFSPVCLSCHQPKQCGKFSTLGPKIAGNCVDCHMPLKQSTMLTSDTNDRTLQLPVRDHRIAIYADATVAR